MPKKNKTLDIILIVVILVGTAFGLYLYFDMNKTYPDEHIAAMFEPITTKYGIRIVYEIGEDFFSPIENPPISVGPGRNSKVEPIKHRFLIRYVDILHKAFEKYPDDIIKKHLKTIHFAGEINEGGLKYGGTYDPFRKIVYLINNGRQTDDLAERVFHHEFSSLLLKSKSFYINPWTDHNPKNFKYLYDLYGSWEELDKIAITLEENEDNYKKGFMNTYGQTNFENDFNEYSAMIFAYPEKFKKIMSQYPRVRGKLKVWLDFYQKIDPLFTEEYLLGN
jgi:hypothetical protein